MIQFSNKLNINVENINLYGVFQENNSLKNIIKEKNFLTYFHEEKEAYIFLGKKEHYSKDDFQETVNQIIKQNTTGLNIFVETFMTSNFSREEIVTILTHQAFYKTHYLWNRKTKCGKILKDETKNQNLNIVAPDQMQKVFHKAKIAAKNTNLVRDIQMMPHNFLNSENYVNLIQDMFKNISNIKINVLNKKDIEAEKMGLLLAVNQGSSHEPRVIVINYQGDAGSKDHLVLVGKGIMYDSGGMNLKTGKFMLGMKYDKSGSAIVAGALKTIAELGYKANVTAVLMCTDNLIDRKSIKPDDVVTAANGMTVEINNTDAEGRLVLADGLVYAAKKLHATHLVDIATLTGAVRVALGETFAGAWATHDSLWKALQESAKEANEKVWRMPFHKNYLKFMKKSVVADLRNTDYTGKGGSSSAAMFLKEFTSDLPFVHLDIAATAKINEKTTGVMVRTLANYAKRFNQK